MLNRNNVSEKEKSLSDKESCLISHRLNPDY